MAGLAIAALLLAAELALIYAVRGGFVVVDWRRERRRRRR